jgi:hypothetical protein
VKKGLLSFLLAVLAGSALAGCGDGGAGTVSRQPVISSPESPGRLISRNLAAGPFSASRLFRFRSRWSPAAQLTGPPFVFEQ